jgi:hypothetical protein
MSGGKDNDLQASMAAIRTLNESFGGMNALREAADAMSRAAEATDGMARAREGAEGVSQAITAADGLKATMEAAGSVSKAYEASTAMQDLMAIRPYDGKFPQIANSAALLSAAQEWTSKIENIREFTAASQVKLLRDMSPVLKLDFTDVQAIPSAMVFPATDLQALSRLAAETATAAGADAEPLSQLDSALEDNDGSSLMADLIASLGTKEERDFLLYCLNALAAVVNLMDAYGHVQPPLQLPLLVQVLFAIALVVNQQLGDI